MYALLRVRATATAPDAPARLTVSAWACSPWAASSDNDGLSVVTVCQSQAHIERWAAGQLFPAWRALGLADVPAGSESHPVRTGELHIR